MVALGYEFNDFNTIHSIRAKERARVSVHFNNDVSQLAIRQLVISLLMKRLKASSNVIDALPKKRLNTAWNKLT
ncbi:hypothetical protein CCR75_007497 [Bremia lactucae]|uniref:Uncharacterized protein n=1 Tax=Bremia lactucae TaxID=4779 RepID=A0A976FG30_BRELC|nr:hypothetical protein CCR75_007497 [Bremia lactucae]